MTKRLDLVVPKLGDKPGVQANGGLKRERPPLTPGYLQALLRELSHIPQALTEIIELKPFRRGFSFIQRDRRV